MSALPQSLRAGPSRAGQAQTAHAPAPSLHLIRAAELDGGDTRRAGALPWSPAGLAGKLVELSGPPGAPCLSLACSLLRQTQEQGGYGVWISAREDSFYPPDLAAAGVDLRELAVVRLSDSPSAGRAADWLLRTGAFSLIVLDLGRNLELSLGLQGRLAQLARRQEAAVLILTEKSRGAPSLSSLVAVRAAAVRERRPEGGFRCGVLFLRDKRRAPGGWHGEACVGPPGLR